MFENENDSRESSLTPSSMVDVIMKCNGMYLALVLNPSLSKLKTPKISRKSRYLENKANYSV
jgi:hypothetical protein